jgi:pimeloyl-ACP methyl ester carboxylesterase
MIAILSKVGYNMNITPERWLITMDSEMQQNNTPDHSGSNEARPYDDAIPYYDYGHYRQPLSGAGSGSTANVGGEWGAGQSFSWPEPSTSGGTPRRRSSFRVVGIIGAVIVVVGALFVTARLLPQVHRVTIHPSFRYVACPFHPGAGITEGRDVRCGFLTVQEDREGGSGATIQLAVAIYKAPGTRVAPDPVVYLTGGPGGALLADWGPHITGENLPRVTLGHDLILLDQRGTGYSKPFLGCHELDEAFKATNAQTSDEAAYDLYTQAVTDCRQRLTRAGVNLQAYTTIENADDVHDLIHSLGYKQVDLNGVSYGTRLALTVMRLFPGDIRSVILDSVVPSQENLFKDAGKDTQHAFDVLFQGCAADVACNNAYPHLADRFYQLVKKWDDQPVTFYDSSHHQVQFSGDDLADWVYHALYDTTLIPSLPKTIMQASQSDYTLLGQDPHLSTEASQDISIGMYNSVVCGEDMDFLTERDLNAAANTGHIELYEYIRSSLYSEFLTCQLWRQNPVPTIQKQPVVSSIPTLILSGDYDPITPPENGKLTASTLSKSYFFQFPGTGHGVLWTNKCPDTIATAFLNNPTRQPDASCIATMPEPRFE